MCVFHFGLEFVLSCQFIFSHWDLQLQIQSEVHLHVVCTHPFLHHKFNSRIAAPSLISTNWSTCEPSTMPQSNISSNPGQLSFTPDLTNRVQQG